MEVGLGAAFPPRFPFYTFDGEGSRPAPPLLNHLVYLFHQADRLCDGNDDPLVVSNVIIRQYASFAALQPFLADSVTADMEVPNEYGYSAKAACAARKSLALLGRVGVQPDGVVRPANPSDLGSLRALIGRDEVV